MTPKEIVQDWFKGLDAMAFEKNASMLSDKHEFHNPMSPIPLSAAEHIGMLHSFDAGFSDARHELDQVLQDGDYVITRGRWKAVHTGEFNGIPATGKSVELPFIDIIHIENGKIGKEHMQFNPMTMMSQMGVGG